MSGAVIGYLTSEYPSPSHTFIRREIASLRAEGLAIRTYSIRAPKHVVDNALEREAVEETFFVLQRGAIGIAVDILAAMFSHPIRFFSVFGLALRHRVPGLKAVLWAIFYFVEAVVLARQLKKDGVTHLHNHFANPAATVGLLAKRYLNIPWSLTLHGISEFDYPAGNLLPAKLAEASFAACVSHFGRAQAMRMIAPDMWSKLHIVRCGIDPQDLPKPNPRTPTSDETEIICVGRLSPEKGHAGLIQAFTRLRDRGLPVSLKLVGDGPQEAALQALANGSSHCDYIRFTGRLDERSTLNAIAQADVMVLPSFMEGLPIVLMEALALGVPAIATRVAGIPELIVEHETGFLFDPGNWADLEEKLATICEDPALRAKLTTAGKARVASEFSYPAAGRPLIDLFSATTLTKTGEPS